MSTENPFQNPKKPEKKPIEPGGMVVFEEAKGPVSPEFNEVVAKLKEKGASSMAMYLDYMESDKKNNLVADMNLIGYSLSILEQLTDHELVGVLEVFRKWSLARDRTEQRQVLGGLKKIID
jgi:hypothetical protein